MLFLKILIEGEIPMNLMLKELPLGHIFREGNLRRQKLKKRSTWNVISSEKNNPTADPFDFESFLIFKFFFSMDNFDYATQILKVLYFILMQCISVCYAY